MARLRNLKHLMLTRAQIDDEGLRGLTALKGLATLQLRGTAITDVGRDLRFPELGYVNFEHTPLTDAGLRHLAHLPKLRCLVISGTRVTNASIETLAAMPSLMEVYASNTGIDQNSVEWLRLMKTLETRRASEQAMILRHAIK